MSKKCQNCGAELADNMNFCPNCHAKVTQAATSAAAEKSFSSGVVPLSEDKSKIIVPIVSSLAVFINLIFLLISQFLFPQISGELCVAGVLVAAVPAVFFSVFAKTSLPTKAILYIGCGLALILNGINFCWQSETLKKHSLGSVLIHQFHFNENLDWRKDITVEGDIYKIPLRKLVADREAGDVYLTFMRSHDKSGKVFWQAADGLTLMWLQAQVQGGAIHVDVDPEEQAQVQGEVIRVDVDPNDPALKAMRSFQNADQIEFEKPNLD